MIKQEYYLGLDCGTDSIGYAVTDEAYALLKSKGEPMIGVMTFDEPCSAQERRANRTGRRRLHRRQQRVQLLQELFAPAIAARDPGFSSACARAPSGGRMSPRAPPAAFSSTMMTSPTGNTIGCIQRFTT